MQGHFTVYRIAAQARLRARSKVGMLSLRKPSVDALRPFRLWPCRLGVLPMKPTTAKWFIRSVAVVELLAGGLQILLVGVALLNGIMLARNPGLTPSGWIAGVGIPGAVFACIGVALTFAWQLWRARSKKRAAYTLAACLTLELIVYGLWYFLISIIERTTPGPESGSFRITAGCPRMRFLAKAHPSRSASFCLCFSVAASECCRSC